MAPPPVHDCSPSLVNTAIVLTFDYTRVMVVLSRPPVNMSRNVQSKFKSPEGLRPSGLLNLLWDCQTTLVGVFLTLYDFEQEPLTAFGLVDQYLKLARCGDIAILLTHLVRLSLQPGEMCVIFH